MTLQEQIKEILIEREFRVSLQEVCESLDVPKRMLRDVLSINGTTYKQLKLEAQEQVARELFGTVSQKRLAKALSFQGPTPHVSLYAWRARNGFDWASVSHPGHRGLA